MNFLAISLETVVVVLGLAVLVADLWTPVEQKRYLGYFAAGVLGVLLVASLGLTPEETANAFGGLYAFDGLALFFKRLFLLAAIFVLLMSVEFADQLRAGVGEFYALVIFALSGMMLAASANDFILMFVSLELITVTFYVLTSFQREKVQSLESGAKYLILGALSTAFTVYGIALVFGVSNTTNFGALALANERWAAQPLFLVGLLMVLVGIGFKLAAFPFQIWAPDVYQGAPSPATAFLAIGSKGAGVVLLLRLLFSAVPAITVDWTRLLIVISAVTILYGNLCAIPQRNLKRLLGYSSMAHAGYLLLGVTAMNLAGSSAILFYLGGYLFTVLAAFTVVCVVLRDMDEDDMAKLAGLHRRSPLLAVALGLAMISLAGIPPLAGFFGKFLLIKAVVEHGFGQSDYGWLLGVALFGIVVSFYYYLNVVRAIFWGQASEAEVTINLSKMTRCSLYVCIAGMLYLGLFPNVLVNWATSAAQTLRFF